MFYHLPLTPSFSALFCPSGGGLTESIGGGTLKCSRARVDLLVVLVMLLMLLALVVLLALLFAFVVCFLLLLFVLLVAFLVVYVELLVACCFCGGWKWVIFW